MKGCYCIKRTALQFIVVLTITRSFASSEYKCITFNRSDATEQFIKLYIACTGTTATNLNTSQKFCRESLGRDDVINFSSTDEYNFIVSQIKNSTLAANFRYVPGFTQRFNNTSMYNPETGQFYWTSDPNTTVTTTSATHWEPFKEYITNFKSLSLLQKQSSYFVLDLNGKLFAGSASSYGNVICSPEEEKIKAKEEEQQKTDSALLPVLTAVAAVTAVAAAIVVGCFIVKFKSRKAKVDSKQHVEEEEKEEKEPDVLKDESPKKHHRKKVRHGRHHK